MRKGRYVTIQKLDSSSGWDIADIVIYPVNTTE